MPSGIFGATLTTLTQGTTANAPDVLGNDQALQSNGVNNDGGLITTDGSGNMALAKILLTTGSIKRIAKFTGSADQVITHNWGEQANIVLAYYNGGFGTAPTQAIAVKNEGANSFEVVGQSGYSWSCLAIKF